MNEEQRKHQEEYYKAKRRYEDAYSEKRRNENEVGNIQNRRKQVINEINDMQTEKKRHIEARDEIVKGYSDNGNIDSDWKTSEGNLCMASQGLLAIGTSSLGNPQNLTEIFEEKNKTTRSALSNVFENLKKAKMTMERKIDEFASKIRQLEAELESGQSRERYLINNIAEQQRIMNNAAIDMAYHRKYML